MQSNDALEARATGAFDGKTEKEVEQALNGVMDYYLTLARINLRLKQEKRNETTHSHNRD